MQDLIGNKRYSLSPGRVKITNMRSDDNQPEAVDRAIERLSSAGGRRQPLDEHGYWSTRGSADWSRQAMLRQLRLMRGLSQRELALKAGMAQSQVARAESERDVRMSTVLRLVETLGCRLEWKIRPIVPFELR